MGVRPAVPGLCGSRPGRLACRSPRLHGCRWQPGPGLGVLRFLSSSERDFLNVPSTATGSCPVWVQTGPFSPVFLTVLLAKFPALRRAALCAGTWFCPGVCEGRDCAGGDGGGADVAAPWPLEAGRGLRWGLRARVRGERGLRPPSILSPVPPPSRSCFSARVWTQCLPFLLRDSCPRRAGAGVARGPGSALRARLRDSSSLFSVPCGFAASLQLAVFPPTNRIPARYRSGKGAVSWVTVAHGHHGWRRAASLWPASPGRPRRPDSVSGDPRVAGVSYFGMSAGRSFRTTGRN